MSNLFQKTRTDSETIERLVVKNPYDQSVVGSAPVRDAIEVEWAIAEAESIFRDRKNWLSKPARIEILHRTANLMTQQRHELAKLATMEGGKPLADSLVEVDRAIEGVRSCCDVLRTQAGRSIPMGINESSLHRSAVTSLEPIGPVLAFSAFNHPLNLIVHQVAPAVAAGCPVVVKSAEATPLSCQRFVDLLHEAGLPGQWCQTIHVESKEVAGQIVADPRFAFFTFIGSGKVGWHLRSKLAPGVRCSLEHGGIAPVIIDHDCDLGEIVPMITKGAFYHAGQVCVSVQRVFVHRSIADEFSIQLTRSAEALLVGDPLCEQTEVGPLIRASEVERVHDWVGEAIEMGAGLLCGGVKLEGNCYAPTVLFDPPQNSRVSTDEIFGPVVCVYPYDTVEEAIALANATSYSFQAAVMTRNIDLAYQVANQVNAATVMVNDHSAFRVDWMPFAGHKNSGLGTGGIAYSIRDMQVEKLMVIHSKAIN